MAEKDVAEKKGSSSSVVVLKVDLHCEGCFRKVLKTLKKIPGVECVEADVAASKVTVAGKVDAEKLRDTLASKTKKKVDIVSPIKKPTNSAPAPAPASDKKSKEPQAATVLLKIRLHCEGCIKRIRKIIKKYRGVYTVEIDSAKDMVTVKGTMNVKEMQDYLKQKLKRNVDVVPPKKEAAAAAGQEKKGDADADKKGNKAAGGAGGGGGDGDKNRGGGGNYGYPNGYMEYIHAPQLFSDENPNACYIM